MLNLYSVYDRKAKQFSNPVVQTNDETAKRWFGYVVANSDMVAKDLELFLVGKFNPDSGVLAVYNDVDITYGDATFIVAADELLEVTDSE